MPRELPGTQAVRVVDVFALGPAMIWAASGWEDGPKWARWFLGISGVATIAFNGVNLIRHARR